VSVNKPNRVDNDSLLTPYTTINGVVTKLGQSVSTFLTGPTSSRPTVGTLGDLYFNQTLNELQIFTTNNWVSVATPPLAPTAVSAVALPVAYGGTPAASIRFTSATSGTPAANYTVTSSPGGIVASGASSPVTISGLTSGTTYTFTVTASNSYGSATSSASSGISASTVPPTPTSVSASQVSNTSVAVSFSTPTNTGGSPITSYTVTALPGGVTATGASSPITVTGLTTNTTYSFNVVANSVAGPSTSSSPSNSLFIGLGYGTVTINNSGSTQTNVVVPVTIQYNAAYNTDFSGLQFSSGDGSILQHWVGNFTPSSNAQVYIKIPSLASGSTILIVGRSSSILSNSTGMFNAFTNFPVANTVPSGWQLFTLGASFTAVPASSGTAGAYTINSGGGGPIAWFTTTTNQGVNVAVDTLATPNVNTAGVTGQNSILEVALHGNATQASSTLTNGLKYRWDARAGTSFKGTIISRSRTSNVATLVLDQTAFQLNTYYPAGARVINALDAINVTADDATFNVVATPVSTVSYNGTQVTITYPNTGANVTTTAVTNTFPNYYYVISQAFQNQGWLNNPFGGDYVANTLTNSAGWNNFDETFAATSQNQTNANGTSGLPSVWRAKYVGTTGSGTFSSYVNNNLTGRNFVENGTRTTSVSNRALTSNVATLSTFPAHGLAVGDTVTITGVGAPFDGVKTVTQVTGGFSFTYAATGTNVTSTAMNPYNGSTTVTASSTRFSQDGIVGVSSHVGSATLNWVAVYPTFVGVADPVYAAL
jgi:hypothetical protein